MTASFPRNFDGPLRLRLPKQLLHLRRNDELIAPTANISRRERPGTDLVLSKIATTSLAAFRSQSGYLAKRRWLDPGLAHLARPEKSCILLANFSHCAD
jgi:hypothetical protein